MALASLVFLLRTLLNISPSLIAVIAGSTDKLQSQHSLALICLCPNDDFAFPKHPSEPEDQSWAMSSSIFIYNNRTAEDDCIQVPRTVNFIFIPQSSAFPCINQIVFLNHNPHASLLRTSSIFHHERNLKFGEGLTTLRMVKSLGFQFLGNLSKLFFCCLECKKCTGRKSHHPARFRSAFPILRSLLNKI